MSRPDVVAIVQAVNDAEAPAADTVADPRLADLIGKGLTEEEAVRLIAAIW